VISSRPKSDALLTVSGVSKKYCPDLRRSSGYGVRDIFSEFLPGSSRTGLRSGEFWALDQVDFELGRGDALAVVGRNGAGKTTLLKLLYGLIKPDRGEIRFSGSMEAIIELGTGFNASLSGRENIEVGAALHRLDRRRTAALVAEVLDFAGLDGSADAPLQTYSSGMKARLSFALSVCLKPDILLVDEALAVGDHGFQRKAIAFIQQYLADGGSLIFVSHNLYQVQIVCDRGLLLDRGRQKLLGSQVDALDAHLAFDRAVDGEGVAHDATGPVAITGLEMRPTGADHVAAGGAAEVVLRYRAGQPLSVVWGFSIWTQDQWICICGAQSTEVLELAPGTGELVCRVPKLQLVGGVYTLKAAILDAATLVPYAMVGFHDGPTPVLVEGAEAEVSARMNNQLMRMEVEWGGSDIPGRSLPVN
jgi:lipopolysaccharide transport system ATP-binding protein